MSMIMPFVFAISNAPREMWASWLSRISRMGWSEEKLVLNQMFEELGESVSIDPASSGRGTN